MDRANVCGRSSANVIGTKSRPSAQPLTERDGLDAIVTWQDDEEDIVATSLLYPALLNPVVDHLKLPACCRICFQVSKQAELILVGQIIVRIDASNHALVAG